MTFEGGGVDNPAAILRDVPIRFDDAIVLTDLYKIIGNSADDVVFSSHWSLLKIFHTTLTTELHDWSLPKPILVYDSLFFWRPDNTASFSSIEIEWEHVREWKGKPIENFRLVVNMMLDGWPQIEDHKVLYHDGRGGYKVGRH